jgi:hypothetical protein
MTCYQANFTSLAILIQFQVVSHPCEDDGQGLVHVQQVAFKMQSRSSIRNSANSRNSADLGVKSP